jgi:hypothetical protein
MLEEVIVSIEDRPGVLADIGELLGATGVNIETFAATTHDDRAVVHLIVDDGEDAGEVLKSNGFKLEGVRSVLAITLDDQPGELGSYCRKLAKAGVGISAAYVARRGGGESEVIFAVDELDVAERI